MRGQGSHYSFYKEVGKEVSGEGCTERIKEDNGITHSFLCTSEHLVLFLMSV